MEPTVTGTQAETKFPLLAKTMGAAQAHAKEATEPEETPAQPAVIAATPEEQPAQPQAVSFKDLDEKAKLKELNELLGTNYKSLDEAKPKAPAKTKEEIEAEKEANKQKSLEWALSTGKVKKDAYEKAIVDKAKSPRELALAIFTQELKEDDPKITQEEAEEQFKDYYHEEAKENSPLRKLGLKKMGKVAENFLKENYGSLDSIDNEYETFRTSEQRQENYGRQVKQVIEALPKELSFSIPYTGVDGKEVQLEYKIPIEDGDLKAVKKDFWTTEMYAILGADKSEVADKVISAEMLAYVQTRKMNDIIAKVATDHAAKVEQDIVAKLKAIPATQSGVSGEAPEAKEPKRHTLLEQTMKKQNFK